MSAVSVLIPTYKSWDLLSKCLAALSRQTISEPFEIIVINNDLDPHIPDELKVYGNVTFLQELKEGSYAARNKGIEAAKGEILVFTDADCIPHEKWLESGIKTLMQTHCGIVAGDIRLFYRNPKQLTVAEVYDKYTAFNQKGYVANRNCVTANWFSYKTIMEEFGYFNSNLKSNGDAELSRKIANKYPIIFDENAIVYHPARYSMEEIIIKYHRVIGGIYDRFFKNTDKDFSKYIRKLIYRRIKFNFNLFLKLKIKDGFMVLIAHSRLLPSIFVESKRILKGSETKRL